MMELWMDHKMLPQVRLASTICRRPAGVQVAFQLGLTARFGLPKCWAIRLGVWSDYSGAHFGFWPET